jgi:hypothetical protein
MVLTRWDLTIVSWPWPGELPYRSIGLWRVWQTGDVRISMTYPVGADHGGQLGPQDFDGDLDPGDSVPPSSSA